VGLFRGVSVLVKAASGPVGASVAGPGGTVPSGTVEGKEVRAVSRTQAAMDALTVSGTFEGKVTLV